MADQHSRVDERQTPLLTTKEAAAYLGVSPSFLERDRWAGAKIPFIRVGNRAVRYRQSVLDRFIEGRLRTDTSDLSERYREHGGA